MILVSYLDSNGHRFRPAEVSVKIFKGGEVNVALPSSIMGGNRVGDRIIVIGHLTNSDMVMAFFLTIDALRRSEPTLKIHAFIPYLPYARQDRVCNSGEALSVALFAKMLNAMNLEQVTLLDPHSDVAPALINNSVVETQQKHLEYILSTRILNINTKNLWLVAPDAGAVKKTKALSEYLQAKGLVSGYVTATKSRNLQTMDITETRFDEDVEGKNLLIVDDICDGGRTFTALAQVLRNRQCGELSLFVTHGIFSYGVDALVGWFDKIYTTNSFHPGEYNELRKNTETIKDDSGISRFRWLEV